MRRILIIGGVAGGASAATRARRLDEHAQITMIERGPYVSFANCGLPYYVSREIETVDELLLETPASFYHRFGVEVLTEREVTWIDVENRVAESILRTTGESTRHHYDELILAPGARPILPKIKGQDSSGVFQLRTVPDAVRLRDYLESTAVHHAVVLGSGFIGLEMAEAFGKRGIPVTLIDKAPQILTPVDRELAQYFSDRIQDQKIHIRLQDTIQEISSRKVYLQSGQELAADAVVLALGVRPDLQLAQDMGFKLGVSGAIWVDSAMHTSKPHVYAAGDAVEKRDLVTGQAAWWPLAGVANKEGRVAGTNAVGGQATLKGALGTAIVRVDPYTIAVTGLTEKTARMRDVSYQVIYTIKGHHASYYPGSQDLFAKILFNPANGRILGAQVAGRNGVDKRIDVLSTAISAQMSVEQLGELDLAYAPPFGAAKDSLTITGMAAENLRNGLIQGITPQKLHQWLRDSGKLPLELMLRDPDEIQETGGIGDFISVPLDGLRQNLSRVPSNERALVVYCRSGHRSYVAARMLLQHGYEKVYNLVGGITAWQAHVAS
ncbi:MAG: FAD-dependent oxidoreductase [Firmicutes bacterium]|nr:FAD-dependent oxidoreductase [Bacillota bacterium]